MSSKIVVVWADIPESLDEWHEKRVAELTSSLSVQASLWDGEDSSFTGTVATLEDPYVTVYHVPATIEHKAFEQQIRMDAQTIKTLPEGLRFDTRCCTRIAHLEKDNYANDKRNISALILSTWQPPPDVDSEAALDWVQAELLPMMLSDKNIISGAMYRRDYVSIFEEGSYRTATTQDETSDYMGVYECLGDELPWEALIDLGQTEGWAKYCEGDGKWAPGQYTLRKLFPEGNENTKLDATKDL